MIHKGLHTTESSGWDALLHCFNPKHPGTCDSSTFLKPEQKPCLLGFLGFSLHLPREGGI